VPGVIGSRRRLRTCPSGWPVAGRSKSSPYFSIKISASRGASRAIAAVTKACRSSDKSHSNFGSALLVFLRRRLAALHVPRYQFAPPAKLPPIKQRLDNRQAIQPGGHPYSRPPREPAGARPPARFPASRHRPRRTGLRARSPPAAASDRAAQAQRPQSILVIGLRKADQAFRPYSVMDCVNSFRRRANLAH